MLCYVVLDTKLSIMHCTSGNIEEYARIPWTYFDFDWYGLSYSHPKTVIKISSYSIH